MLNTTIGILLGLGVGHVPYRPHHGGDPRYTAATRRAMRGKRYPHSSAKQHAKCAERDYDGWWLGITHTGENERRAPIIQTLSARRRYAVI